MCLIVAIVTAVVTLVGLIGYGLLVTIGTEHKQKDIMKQAIKEANKEKDKKS